GLVAGEGHRVHDVHDVELIDLLGSLVGETYEVTREIVDRLCYSPLDEVLDVAPHGHDILRRGDLLLFRQAPVGEEHPRAAPFLEQIGVTLGEAEEAERPDPMAREGGGLAQVDDGLALESLPQDLTELAQARRPRADPAGRHHSDSRLAPG